MAPVHRTVLTRMEAEAVAFRAGGSGLGGHGRETEDDLGRVDKVTVQAPARRHAMCTINGAAVVMAGRLHGCTNERDGDAPPDPTCNPCAWVRYVPACTSVPRLVYGGGTIIGLIMQPISASDCSLTYRRSIRSVSNWIVVVNGSCDPVEQERNSYLAAPPPSDSENPNYSLLAPFPPR
jgi:hypothetical protein